LIAILIERYVDLVSGMGMNKLKNREDVNDLVADIFIVLQEKLKEVEVQNFKSWLCTIVRNKLHDQFRKKKIRADYAIQYLNTGTDSFEIELSFQFDLPHLEKAMSRISPEESYCIKKIYLEELNYQDIMEEKGWTFNQVRGYRQRGMKKLKDLLTNEFEDYFKN
jgi:RNA polymerase sigma factor (sigma-70 family)